jgi:GntR family transcriptional regulator
MKIHVDPRLPAPIYEQISEQIQLKIHTGAVRPRAQLPSVRELARQTGINPLTVARAYLELARKGYLVSRVGHLRGRSPPLDTCR